MSPVATTADTIVITGATGFVGSAIAAMLLATTPHRLVALVRNDPDGRRLEAAVGRALHGLYGTREGIERMIPMAIDDLSEGWPLASVLEGLAARELWHVAAHMSYRAEGLVDAVQFNVGFSVELLQAIGGLERVFHISTTSVAGPGNAALGWRAIPEERLAWFEALNPYNVSKCLAEHTLWQASEETGVGLCILRLPAVVGAARDGWAPPTRIGYYAYLQVLKRFLGRSRTFAFAIDPEGRIPILHLDHLADICRRLRARPAMPAREVFNLCNAEPPTVRAQFETFEATVGHRLRIEYGAGETAASQTFNRLNAHNNLYMSTRHRFAVDRLAGAIGAANLPRTGPDAWASVFRYALAH